MSTDLQLPHHLPSIRLTSLKLKLPVELELDNEDECQTPTSHEHKIPEISTCPPAPKKQRLYAPSCKRRISEFDAIETVAPHEIESFFESSYEFINRNSITNKRKKKNS